MLLDIEVKLVDAQNVGDLVIDAKAKLGEMLENRAKKIRSSQGGTSKPLPPGITKKQSHRAQVIARHPEKVTPGKGIPTAPGPFGSLFQSIHPYISGGHHF